MDMDMAHCLLTETKKDKENVAASPSKEAYRRLLAEKLLNNQMWIFGFRNKLSELVNVSIDAVSSHLQVKPAKQRRHIPQVCTRTTFSDGNFVQGFNTLWLLNLEDNHIDSWDEIVKFSFLRR
jgi:hypothetical protein